MFKLGGPALPADKDPVAQVRHVLTEMGTNSVSEPSVRVIRGMVVVTMACDEEADRIRADRKRLGGSGLVVGDFLSKDEWIVFKSLQPAFQRARRDGKAAYFDRARLFVNGEEVKAPAPPPSV